MRRVRGLAAVLCAFALAACQTSGTPGGMVATDYLVNGLPPGGLQEIMFRTRVDVDPGIQARYFWAQQYYIVNAGPSTGGYVGLQTWGNDGFGGTSRVAVFSVFGAGIVPVTSNCSGGADGGPGVTCRLTYAWSAHYVYQMEIRKDGNWFTAWITESGGGQTLQVGTFATPSGWGAIDPRASSFTEYFVPVASCQAIPYARVTNFAPTGDWGLFSGKILRTRTYGSNGGGNIDCRAVATTWIDAEGEHNAIPHL